MKLGRENPGGQYTSIKQHKFVLLTYKGSSMDGSPLPGVPLKPRNELRVFPCMRAGRRFDSQTFFPSS